VSGYEGIVLAGGFGTRLRSVVPDLPKPLAPIGGRPFLEILLTDMARKGFSRIVLSVGFMADKIVEHFGDRFAGLELAYEIEEAPLGTGGAVRLAMERIVGDHVYVLNGDTFLDVDFGALEQRWLSHQRPVIVGLEIADASRYGRLVVEKGRVCAFIEKGHPGPGIINGGCYVLTRNQLDSYALGTAFSLESDYLALAVVQSPFELFITAGRFIDIGVPADYARAQACLP
jgi:D-glycero-alpha-D-manno-heptose 1-phosphate guanylyltransferase